MGEGEKESEAKVRVTSVTKGGRRACRAMGITRPVGRMMTGEG